MTTNLNFGHKQNSDKSLNSKLLMKNLISNMKQVSLTQVSKILLAPEDVKTLTDLGCTVIDLDSPSENPLRLHTVLQNN